MTRRGGGPAACPVAQGVSLLYADMYVRFRIMDGLFNRVLPGENYTTS